MFIHEAMNQVISLHPEVKIHETPKIKEIVFWKMKNKIHIAMTIFELLNISIKQNNTSV